MFWENIRDAFKRTIIVHLVYAIIILGFSFYLLLSVRFAEVEALRDILNFALGFASLFLALVAIFQTLASGADLHRVLGLAVSSTEEVKRASSEFTEKVVPHAERIVRGADEVSEQGKLLLAQSEQINDLLAHLQGALETNFTEQRSLLESLNTKFDQPKALNLDTNEQGSSFSKPQDGPAQFSAYQMSRRATVGGHCAIYAVIRSFQKNTPIVLNDIFENVRWRMYTSGILSTLDTLGVIEMERQGSEFTIKSINMNETDKFIEQLTKQIIKSGGRKTADDTEGTDNSFLTIIRAFYNYFDDPFPLDEHSESAPAK